MIGARGGLGAAFLAAFLVTGHGAGAQPAASTWTDPPVRAPAAAPQPRPDPAPEPPPTKAAPPEEARRHHPEPATREAAGTAAPHEPAKRAARTRGRDAAPSRAAERTPDARRARTKLATRPRGEARSSLRTGASPRPRRYAGPAWRGIEPTYAYEGDSRLDRLQSAADAGYIVMRRRSVEFPDGRSLRVYRPYEEDDGAF